MGSYATTKKEFTERVTQREDNHFYKYEMVREIINMYNEEMRKALLNGEKINISGIGTISPTVQYIKPNFIPPSHSDGNYEAMPFVNVKLNKNQDFKNTIDAALRRNLKTKGKLELSPGFPPLSNTMKKWEEEYVKTHQ